MKNFFPEFWTEWRGSLDGRPAMYIKRLVWFPVGYSFARRKVLSVRIDLHKMVRADDPGCFHTHPAHAIRIVLKGGYAEECSFLARNWISCDYWFPGMIGFVAPDFCNRVSHLFNSVSYSLWIRGPIIADVQLIGDGWPADKRGAHPERN